MRKRLLPTQAVCCDQAVAATLASSLQFTQHFQCVQNITTIVSLVKIRKEIFGETKTVVFKLTHSGIIWRALKTEVSDAPP